MSPRKKPDAQAPATGEDAVAEGLSVDIGELTVESEQAEGGTLVDQMVTFHLAGQRYGLPIAKVQEIQQIVAFTGVPSAGSAVIGMINLRGQVIPAIDLRALFGLPHLDYHLDTPMVICRVEGHMVALVVDEVEDVINLPEGCMSPPPGMHALASKMIGVCRLEAQLVFLLDVDRLVAPVDLGQE